MKRVDVNERFMSKIDFSGECWEWTATVTPGGYGSFAPIRTIRGWRASCALTAPRFVTPFLAPRGSTCREHLKSLARDTDPRLLET
jgi:hypothetical protein